LIIELGQLLIVVQEIPIESQPFNKRLNKPTMEITTVIIEK